MAFTYAYDPIGIVEDLEQYEPGGFLPVIPGDRLGENGRFEIVEKLGSGGNATVWMCRDELHNKWKAVKILTATASGMSDDDCCTELVMLKHFGDVDREELEANHICLPEEYFWEEGPYGRHLCFVLPLLGSSIKDVWDSYGDRPDILRAICIQLVEAMKFLHSKGVCHGDFRTANILFKLKGVEDLSHDEIMAMLPETEEVPVVPVDVDDVAEMESEPQLPINYPQFVYTATSLIAPPDSTTFDIAITDFGEAYHVSKPFTSNGIPLGYAAPEVILGGDEPKFGFATDIWALGATICEVRQGTIPFCPEDKDMWVKRLEEILGPLPEPYRSNYIDQGYTSRWGLPPASEIPPTDLLTWTSGGLKQFRDHGFSNWLERTVRKRITMTLPREEGEDLTTRRNQWALDDNYKRVVYQTPHKEADQLLDLLAKIFRYSPTERLPIAEIMDHPWLTLEFEEDDEWLDEDNSIVQDPLVADTPITTTCPQPIVMNDDDLMKFQAQFLANPLHHLSFVPVVEPLSPTITEQEEDEDSDHMDLDIDELESLHRDAEIKDVPEEDDFDREFKKDPLGALYQECKELWYQKHPLERRLTASTKPKPEEARNIPSPTSLGSLYQECKEMWYQKHPLERRLTASTKAKPEEARDIPTPSSDYMDVDSDEDQETGYQRPPYEDADATSALHFFQLVGDIGNVLFMGAQLSLDLLRGRKLRTLGSLSTLF